MTSPDSAPPDPPAAAAAPSESAPQTGDAVKPPKPPRIWKFWGTLGWSLVLFAVMNVASLIAVFLVLYWKQIDPMTPFKQLEPILTGGTAMALNSALGFVPLMLTVMLAVRLARQRLADYLALRWPSWRHAAIFLGAMALLLPMGDAFASLAGKPITPDVIVHAYRSARADGTLWLFGLALVITAPIGEEIIFRGFIYRGLSESWLRPVGAVIVSAILFAVIHTQYDWFFMAQVMMIGLLLGVARAASGSLLLTIMMHALHNSAAFVQVAWHANVAP